MGQKKQSNIYRFYFLIFLICSNLLLTYELSEKLENLKPRAFLVKEADCKKLAKYSSVVGDCELRVEVGSNE